MTVSSWYGGAGLKKTSIPPNFHKQYSLFLENCKSWKKHLKMLLKRWNYGKALPGKSQVKEETREASKHRAIFDLRHLLILGNQNLLFDNFNGWGEQKWSLESTQSGGSSGSPSHYHDTFLVRMEWRGAALAWNHLASPRCSQTLTCVKGCTEAPGCGKLKLFPLESSILPTSNFPNTMLVHKDAKQNNLCKQKKDPSLFFVEKEKC